MAIREIQIYLFAFSFLIVSIIITIGLYYLGKAFPGQDYYNPLGLIVGFGPLITAVIFILVNRNDKFRDVALKKFNVQLLMKIVVILVFVYVIEYLLFSFFGLVEFRLRLKQLLLYNTEFGNISYLFIAFLIPFVYTGIGEEYGWRGYLFHKLIGLKWVEHVLILNLVWALWHVPIILYGIMGGFSNFSMDFILFTIQAIELGIILVYVRLKSGSVIPVMILHGFINFFHGIVLPMFYAYIKSSDWSQLILIFLLLPFAIYYYTKGRKLYNERLNTVANMV